MTKYVAYYRVSTDKQGRSGLGLDAQREAVWRFLGGDRPPGTPANRIDDGAPISGTLPPRHRTPPPSIQIGSHTLIAEYTERASGKNNTRREFEKAKAKALAYGATLIIAKLDRLSRNVHFISGLMESKVPFRVCDLPELNELTVHIYAAIAQHEAEMISQRTKAALAQARIRLEAKGERLGRPDAEFSEAQSKKGARKSARTRRIKAKAFAQRVAPAVKDIKALGITSLAGIAAELNARGVTTQRGAVWYPATVAALLRKLR